MSGDEFQQLMDAIYYVAHIVSIFMTVLTIVISIWAVIIVFALADIAKEIRKK